MTALLKKYACHAKIQDGDHVFKMDDMSGKEIFKFAKNVPTCRIGMIMVSNRIVWRSMHKTNLDTLVYPEASFCRNLNHGIKVA